MLLKHQEATHRVSGKPIHMQNLVRLPLSPGRRLGPGTDTDGSAAKMPLLTGEQTDTLTILVVTVSQRLWSRT